MLERFRLTIGGKIYLVLALTFVVFLAVTYYQIHVLDWNLDEQKRAELKQLTDIALRGVEQEYAAAQKGTISTAEAQKLAKDRLRELRFGQGDYFWINDMSGRMLMHPAIPALEGKDITGLKDPTGKLFVSEYMDAVRRHNEGYVYYEWAKPGSQATFPKVSYAVGFAPWGWVICTGVYLDQLHAQMRAAAINVLVVTALALLGAAAVAGQVTRGVARAMRGMTAAMAELAAGRFDVVLPGLGRRDEVGDVAAAVEAFKVRAADRARHEAEARAEAERRAADDKRAAEEQEAMHQRTAEEKATAERNTAMRTLADEFERAVGRIIDNVSTASTELEATATTLTGTAATTQQLSTVVASASEEASANVQSVASATEEMAGSLGQISRQVQDSSAIAAEAVAQAQKTDARVAELSQAANRIGDVVKLITAIAEQTNLLALNATIEAARAGEAGKGFAVVAQEVKALAAQTAKATGEIGLQISSMQTATQDSVAAIKEIGGTIGRISHITAGIAAAVEEQGTATQEIARNVQNAAKGTAEVASNIVGVNRGAGETGSASSRLLTSAQSLARESNHLKVEVQRFLATVRAA